MQNENNPDQSITYFDQGEVANRVIRYNQRPELEKCIFIPNWRAKSHHWEGFCNCIARHYNLDYFETREKPNTVSIEKLKDHDNELMAADIIHYINAQSDSDYHLILCSFAAPLVFSQWERLHNKPKSLVLICPINSISLPWIVSVFSKIPPRATPFLYKAIYKLAHKVISLKPICYSLKALFRKGDLSEITNLQSSIRHVLKLDISISKFNNAQVPTLIVKSLNDKIHSPKKCHLIHKTILNSILIEVENFKEAHDISTAKRLCSFLNTHEGKEA